MGPRYLDHALKTNVDLNIQIMHTRQMETFFKTKKLNGLVHQLPPWMQVEQMEVKNIYTVGFGLTSIKFRVKFSTGENPSWDSSYDIWLQSNQQFQRSAPETKCRIKKCESSHISAPKVSQSTVMLKGISEPLRVLCIKFEVNLTNSFWDMARKTTKCWWPDGPNIQSESLWPAKRLAEWIHNLLELENASI